MGPTGCLKAVCATKMLGDSSLFKCNENVNEGAREMT